MDPAASKRQMETGSNLLDGLATALRKQIAKVSESLRL